jgi:protein kinase-like protein
MQCHECNAHLPGEARFCLSCGARVEVAASDSPGDPLLEALDKAIGFQYRIHRRLGRGGMGAVYLAHELALDRDVAIKVLPPDQAETAELRERFRLEARTAARLSHPNIVPLYTFGEVSGLVYFVMGYVAGESLANRLRREGPIDPEAARALLAAVCDALDYAHRQGVVHRDIKPDNILIDAESGAPRLADFGIAKAAFTDANLTTTGQVVGTPHYMSPEQAMGRPEVSPRSDLFSLGVVAFEMLSGRRPFGGGSPLDALTQRLTQDAPPLASVAPRVPADLTLAVDRCLRRDPAHRWPDAKSLREALMPTEEEAEDPQAVRVLRTITTALLFLVLASAYLGVVEALQPGSLDVLRAGATVGGAVLGLSIAGTVMAIRLRMEGDGTKNIILKVFQQPRWWRSWYPRSLRRRGDVWDRLPREFRQSRAYRGLFLVCILAVFMPLNLISLWEGRLLELRLGMTFLILTGLAVLFALRRRAVRAISEKLRAPYGEALTILNIPSWRVSMWRRPPASSLLAGPGGATPSPLPESQSTMTLAGAAGTYDRPST